MYWYVYHEGTNVGRVVAATAEEALKLAREQFYVTANTWYGELTVEPKRLKRKKL